MDKNFEYYLEMAVYKPKSKIRLKLENALSTTTLVILAAICGPYIIPKIIIDSYNNLKGDEILKNPENLFKKIYKDAKKINPNITEEKAKKIFNNYIRTLAFQKEYGQDKDRLDRVINSDSMPGFTRTLKEKDKLAAYIANDNEKLSMDYRGDRTQLNTKKD